MGTLYIVATPIGNMNDISFRAVETLQTVDFVACEDTRVSGKFLQNLQIDAKLISYHHHNRIEKIDEIVNRLKNGENGALISDAGTPCISDPGFELVRTCHKNNIKVCAVPGASAFVAAVSICGLDTSKIIFEGFLETVKSARVKRLENIKNNDHTLVFFESKHKLKNTLVDMFEVLGDRKISVIREITKVYENVTLTTLSEAVLKCDEVEPRGEYVLVVEGAGKTDDGGGKLEKAVKFAEKLAEHGLSVNQAAKIVAVEFDVKKRDVYANLTEKMQDL